MTEPIAALDQPDALAIALGGRRVALLAGPAAVTRNGRTAAEALAEAGAEIRCLFAPEHGLARAAAGEAVPDGIDPATGLETVSLYGPRLMPEPRHLTDIDAVAIDLPTLGLRCYTFFGTAIETMTAAARAGVETVVLDRPNPLGRRVEGSPGIDRIRRLLSPAALPHRFGLTLGEALCLVAAERGMPAPTVVPVEGWTGAPVRPEAAWRPPSPGLPTPACALAYPATVFLEATALDEGRGSASPFAWFGAPWLDSSTLAERLGETLAGAGEAVPETRHRSSGPCPGVRLLVRDADRFAALETALAILGHVRDRHPGALGATPALDALAGRSELRLWCGMPGLEAEPLLARWREEARHWSEATASHRLYPGPVR